MGSLFITFFGATFCFPQKQFKIIGKVLIALSGERHWVFQGHRPLLQIENLFKHQGPN